MNYCMKWPNITHLWSTQYSDSQAAVDSDEEEEDKDVQESANEDDDDGGEGMEVLLREGDHSPTVPTSPRPKKEISHIAATAESLQPKGYTLATTKVATHKPSETLAEEHCFCLSLTALVWFLFNTRSKHQFHSCFMVPYVSTSTLDWTGWSPWMRRNSMAYLQMKWGLAKPSKPLLC